MADDEELGAPDEQPQEPTRVLGTPGLRAYDGYVDEEFLDELKSDQFRKFREMGDNDPVAGGTLLVIEMIFRSSPWSVRPPEGMEDSSEAQEVAETFGEDLQGLAHPFDHTLAELTGMFQHGWAWFEEIYAKADDGRMTIHRFAPRSQRSLFRWSFDEQGMLDGMIQQDLWQGNGQTVKLPLNKALHLRTSHRADNPEGRSILRTSYRAWSIKKHIENIEAVGIERDLVGLPVIYAPESLWRPDASAKQRNIRQALNDTLTHARRDDADGLLMPTGYDGHGNRKYEIELLSSGGKRQIDPSASIERWSRQQTMATLTDFIMLGHEQTGSFALSQDKTNVFAMAVDAWQETVGNTIARTTFRRMARFQGIEPELVPRLRFDPARTPSPDEIVEWVAKLAKSGMLVNDPETEEWAREQIGAPPPPDPGDMPEEEEIDPGGDDEQQQDPGDGSNGGQQEGGEGA